jgi:phenylacetate-CoA ligase
MGVNLMHPFFAKHFFYYPIQFLRGQKVKACLHQVISHQNAPLKELEELRDRKIIDLVNHAYEHIPYYREKFDEKDIHPSLINGYKDLAYLPILSKSEILLNENRLVVISNNKRLYTRKTSGSTGMTLHFKKDANALGMNDAIMWRCYHWYGINVGERQVRFWGVPVTKAERFREYIKDTVLNRIRISAFDISASASIRQLERIERFKPAYFYGYTSAIYGFCLFLKEQGRDFRKLNLMAVICTAEKMYDHHRVLLEEMFDCPVVDEYGSSENGIIAFQCRHGNMHMMADHLCIEFLDEDGKSVKPGELGRIVITDLASYHMPLIRYDIGDIGRYTERICTCGVNLPLMEIVEGRKEDFIRLKGGKMVHAAYLCYTLKDDSVYEFKMYQKDIDRLLVLIVKSPQFGPHSEAMLKKKLRSALSAEVSISFNYVDTIPRDKSGKLRYFVSEVHK